MTMSTFMTGSAMPAVSNGTVRLARHTVAARSIILRSNHIQIADCLCLALPCIIPTCVCD